MGCTCSFCLERQKLYYFLLVGKTASYAVFTINCDLRLPQFYDDNKPKEEDREDSYIGTYFYPEITCFSC